MSSSLPWNDVDVIAEFRANSGQVEGTFAGVELVLLTTTGARTGNPRTTPVARFSDGARLYVIASAAGAQRHPAWYHNLLADPELTVETGTQTYRARAVPVVDDAERTRLYAQAVALHANFGTYQTMTSRRIPVVWITRCR